MKISAVKPKYLVKTQRTNSAKANLSQSQATNSITSLKQFPNMNYVSFGSIPTTVAKQRMINTQTRLNLYARAGQIKEQIEFTRSFDIEEEQKTCLKNIEADRQKLGFFKRKFSEKANQEIIDKHLDKLREKIAKYNSIINNMPNLQNELQTIAANLQSLDDTDEYLTGVEAEWTAYNNEKKAKMEHARQLNEILNGKGGLDDQIAGYESEKETVAEYFLQPIVKEIESGEEQEIPSALFLYGATGTGKTTFAEALINSIKLQAIAKPSVIRTDDDDDEDDDNSSTPPEDEVRVYVETLIKPSDEEFQKFIYDKLDAAQQRYNNTKAEGMTGVRTVYVINEVEDHLSAQKAESGDDDAKKIKANIDYMKTVLDHCAELPKPGKESSAFATTFFFTTNYPKVIHEDLLSREEKLGLQIALHPAEKEDIAKILKFYTQRAAKYIEVEYPQLKFNPDDIPFEKLAEVLQPDENGAFSNSVLKLMIMRRGVGKYAGALYRYIKHPEQGFASHLADVALTEKKDIAGERYQKFLKTYEQMERKKDGRLEALQKKESLGLLSQGEQVELELLRKTGLN